MCIVAFAFGTHADAPFVLIHNRDERLDRATVPPCGLAEWGRSPTATVTDDSSTSCNCSFCASAPELLCARDLERGGTWLGLNMRTGAFAALTNYSPLLVYEERVPRTATTSRGDAVLRFLREPALPQHSHSKSAPFALDLGAEYSGFHCLTANLFDNSQSPILVSNAPCAARPVVNNDTRTASCTPLTTIGNDRGCCVHSFSNGSVGVGTAWPKCDFLRHALARALQRASPLLDQSNADADGEAAIITCLLDLLPRVMQCTRAHGPDDDASLSSKCSYTHCRKHCPQCACCSASSSLDDLTACSVSGDVAFCVHCAHADQHFASVQGCSDIRQAHPDTWSLSSSSTTCSCIAASAPDARADARAHLERDHRVVCFPHDGDDSSLAYGTRAQTIIVRLASSVYYLYRNLDGGGSVASESSWRFRRVAVPNSVAAPT